MIKPSEPRERPGYYQQQRNAAEPTSSAQGDGIIRFLFQKSCLAAFTKRSLQDWMLMPVNDHSLPEERQQRANSQELLRWFVLVTVYRMSKPVFSNHCRRVAVLSTGGATGRPGLKGEMLAWALDTSADHLSSLIHRMG